MKNCGSMLAFAMVNISPISLLIFNPTNRSYKYSINKTQTVLLTKIYIYSLSSCFVISLAFHVNKHLVSSYTYQFVIIILSTPVSLAVIVSHLRSRWWLYRGKIFFK